MLHTPSTVWSHPCSQVEPMRWEAVRELLCYFLFLFYLEMWERTVAEYHWHKKCVDLYKQGTNRLIKKFKETVSDHTTTVQLQACQACQSIQIGVINHGNKWCSRWWPQTISFCCQILFWCSGAWVPPAVGLLSFLLLKVWWGIIITWVGTSETQVCESDNLRGKSARIFQIDNIGASSKRALVLLSCTSPHPPARLCKAFSCTLMSLYCLLLHSLSLTVCVRHGPGGCDRIVSTPVAFLL